MYLLIMLMFLCSHRAINTIPDIDFEVIKQFLYHTNLDNASPDIYKKYMDYAQKIEESGSPEQQHMLEQILAGEYEEPQKDTITTQLSHIETILTSDIITPEIWKESISTLKTIDTTGSAEDRKKLGTFINHYKNRIIYHMNSIIQSVLHDSKTQAELKKTLQFIVIGTLLGVIPSIGIASLKVLSGNLPLVRASENLIDIGILSALDSIVRFGLQNRSEYITGPVAAGLSTAVQDFIGFVGPRPHNINLFGATITTPELAMLQATALTLAKDTLSKAKGPANIIKNLDFNDIGVGSSNIVSAPQEGSLIGYLQESLTLALKNETVRNTTATVLSYAVEGALLSLIVNAAGFGFYQESTTAALASGMMRGALEGLYIYGTRQAKPTGILQRINSGASMLSVQNYLTKGVIGINTLDIAPLMTQQIIAGAMNGIVQKTGGWNGLVNTLFYNK